MGLGISHDTWDGSYSAFHRWRKRIAQAANYPPLEIMEGYYKNDNFSIVKLSNYDDTKVLFKLPNIQEQLPIKWEGLKKSPLIILLTHSDCDGIISWRSCRGIARELEKILPNIGEEEDGGGHVGNYRKKTKIFIEGLMNAYNAKENLRFG